MYPWLVVLLARWRSEGRRPPAVAGRGSGILLRSSHVRDTSRDEELVRPMGLGEASPDADLLRVPATRPEDRS